MGKYFQRWLCGTGKNKSILDHKWIINHGSMKFFRVRKRILPALKDMDSVIVGFICNKFAFYKARHRGIDFCSMDFISNENMVDRLDIVIEPPTRTIEGTKFFDRMVFEHHFDFIYLCNKRTIIGAPCLFQVFLVRGANHCDQEENAQSYPEFFCHNYVKNR